MKSRIARSCSTLILSLCVLPSLLGCESANVATRSDPVEVPVYVTVKIDEKLLRYCDAKYRYPAGSMKIEHIKDKVAALEDALAMCNNDKELIRAAQDKDLEPTRP